MKKAAVKAVASQLEFGGHNAIGRDLDFPTGWKRYQDVGKNSSDNIIAEHKRKQKELHKKEWVKYRVRQVVERGLNEQLSQLEYRIAILLQQKEDFARVFRDDVRTLFKIKKELKAWIASARVDKRIVRREISLISDFIKSEDENEVEKEPVQEVEEESAHESAQDIVQDFVQELVQELI